MNKGLEVIEAHELFGVDYDQIEVVVHPQSRRALDGRVHRRRHDRPASLPDMRLPIGYALGLPGPDRHPVRPIDWAELGRLDFEPPDLEAFRASASPTRRAGAARPRRRG